MFRRRRHASTADAFRFRGSAGADAATTTGAGAPDRLSNGLPAGAGAVTGAATDVDEDTISDIYSRG